MDSQALLRKLPSYGPNWDAAIDFGIDVVLLLRNLELTPTERIEQLSEMTELVESLRGRPQGSDAENT